MNIDKKKHGQYSWKNTVKTRGQNTHHCHMYRRHLWNWKSPYKSHAYCRSILINISAYLCNISNTPPPVIKSLSQNFHCLVLIHPSNFWAHSSSTDFPISAFLLLKNVWIYELWRIQQTLPRCYIFPSALFKSTKWVKFILRARLNIFACKPSLKCS